MLKKEKMEKAERPIWDFEKKRIIWKNFLLPKISHVLFLLWILFIVWSYNHDLGECREVYYNPGDFCAGYCEERRIGYGWGGEIAGEGSYNFSQN